jgi:hypothetical protein
MSPREMLNGSMEGHIGNAAINLPRPYQGTKQVGKTYVIFILVKELAYLSLLSSNIT